MIFAVSDTFLISNINNFNIVKPNKDKAQYIGITVAGPYKPEYYRY